jgi:hypothetical protein
VFKSTTLAEMRSILSSRNAARRSPAEIAAVVVQIEFGLFFICLIVSENLLDQRRRCRGHRNVSLLELEQLIGRHLIEPLIHRKIDSEINRLRCLAEPAIQDFATGGEPNLLARVAFSVAREINDDFAGLHRAPQEPQQHARLSLQSAAWIGRLSDLKPAGRRVVAQGSIPPIVLE